MRILLATARYAPHRGGLETVVRELAREMTKGGHELALVTSRYPKTLPEYEDIDGIKVTRFHFLYPALSQLRSGRHDLFAAGLLLMPVTLFQFLAIILNFRPDVVNLHYAGSPTLFVLLASCFFRFRLVVSLHGGDVDSEPHQNRFKRRLFEAIVRRADVVTACSYALREQALELVPDIGGKIEVIHNGVDARMFSSATPYQHTRPYLFAVGQLAHHKGFDVLISAFADIAEEAEDVDVLIAGEGQGRAALEEQIETLGLATKVHLLGAVQNEQVASLMRGSRCVVIPSRRESFGIVGLEAMAAGRPIIASKVGGLVEALEGAVVDWIAPGDSSGLVTALRTCFSSETDNGGQVNQLQAVMSNWQHVAERYLAFYA